MTNSKTIKKHEILFDLSSQEYHQAAGSYSSSQLKDILTDEDLFIKKYITKEIEREEFSAFDVGTYFHTGVLEPHKLNAECAVYPGKVRRGPHWDKFKEKHDGKLIINESQASQAQGLIKAVKQSAIAQAFLTGLAEASLFIELEIGPGEIRAPYFKQSLTSQGWMPTSRGGSFPGSQKFVIKVRADLLGDTFISDLKSTSGNARQNYLMRRKISDYHYDLSASLYLDLFRLVRPEIKDFIWIFASKDSFSSRCYKASDANILVGRAKYMKTLFKLAECAKNNWILMDFLDTLEPLPHELSEHLKPKDADLL